MQVPTSSNHSNCVAFIGGGNMATALIGGMVASGHAASQIVVVEPDQQARERLLHKFSLQAEATAHAGLAQAGLLVWAVKPQSFGAAAAACAPWVGAALHLSVMAGIRCQAITAATGSARVVRSMPNTPALIGRGVAGLYAMPQVSQAERERVQALLAPTGATVWLGQEADLDAVTALSGSGPAYVFYLLEALLAAGQRMGLAPEQARTLALATLDGATELARRASEPPQTLRAQVTSKGGTTHAAISHLEAAGVGACIEEAVLAAQRRARELGNEFGR